MSVSRKCKKCSEFKSTKDFTKNKNCKDGIEHTCRKCTTKNALKWEYANPEKHNHSYLMYKYGISWEDYARMYKLQKGLCAICGQPETDSIPKRHSKRKTLATDHCHVSGKVRALLCRSCNTGLGCFKDSENILTKALSYLKFHR